MATVEEQVGANLSRGRGEPGRRLFYGGKFLGKIPKMAMENKSIKKSGFFTKGRSNLNSQHRVRVCGHILVPGTPADVAVIRVHGQGRRIQVSFLRPTDCHGFTEAHATTTFANCTNHTMLPLLSMSEGQLHAAARRSRECTLYCSLTYCNL